MEKFEFRLAKRTRTGKNKVRIHNLGYFISLIEKEDGLLISQNSLLAERVAQLIKETCQRFREF